MKHLTMVIPLDVIQQFNPDELSEARLHMLLHQIMEGTSPGLFAYVVLRPIIELNKMIEADSTCVSRELEHAVKQFMKDFNVTYTWED